eukprot:538280-Alexandrium_andersonii.AAC.1
MHEVRFTEWPSAPAEIAVKEWREGCQVCDTGHWWLDDNYEAISRNVEDNGPSFQQLCRALTFTDRP